VSYGAITREQPTVSVAVAAVHGTNDGESRIDCIATPAGNQSGKANHAATLCWLSSVSAYSWGASRQRTPFTLRDLLDESA